MTDSSTIIGFRQPETQISRAPTLDGFVAEVAGSPGINLRELDPLTTLVVRTRNSSYRVIMSHDTSVIVQGGRFFPDATPARIDGSGFGGSLLKIGWIGIGLSMEIFADGQRIITSPVRAISIESERSRLAH